MKSRPSILAAWCLVGLWSLTNSTLLLAACGGSEKVGPGETASIAVDSVAALRRIEPHYFGFSFVWVEFQESIWNAAARRADSTVVKWLRDFPGAVYRFPGGTESNYYDWKAAVGTPDKRPGRKIVKWKDSVVADFGLAEYLALVRDVGGQPWYVANLYGEYEKEGDARKLAAEAGQLAAYLSGKDAMLRWELGNELDRGDYGWGVGKYLEVARPVAEAIRLADPQARFVAIMEDYDAHWRWKRQRAADYNREVAKGLTDLASEYAQHSYYDGVNVEVLITVPSRIAQICQSIEAAEKARPAAGPVGIWVTEHARQPVKTAKNADWRPTWSHSANLEAALGVADFMIAATQVPEIQGLFVHALHGLGVPWPMFHQTKAGTPFHPSAVFLALHLLRQGMEANVMKTVSRSPNLSGYTGGYDMRATVLADADRKRWAVWAVNRANQGRQVTLKIPALAGKTLKASMRALGDENLNASNYLDGTRLQTRDLPMKEMTFGTDGSAQIDIPMHSVVVARFEVK